MKKIIMATLSLVAIAAFGDENKIVTSENARFVLCPTQPPAPGCTDTIQVDGTRTHYAYDNNLDPKVKDCLEGFNGTYSFHQFRQTPFFHVTGYYKKASGVFPAPPTLEMEVFFITGSDNVCYLPLPK